MRGKIAVITGASDGIGAAAARQLRALGATVVVIGRSEPKTRAVARELQARYFAADFTRLSEVRGLAAQLRRNLPRIDVLANNAGGMFGARELTADGREKTLQVNHLAHFLLTTLLLDVLMKSRATVINTSSVAHRFLSRLDIADLDLEKNYSAARAYGNAKLMNILFAKELHRRCHDQGLSAAAFHPGGVATNFANDPDSPMRLLYHTPLKRLAGLIRPEQGADTLVWLAASVPGRDWQSGGYYAKRKPAKVHKQADDLALSRALWEKSERMISG